MICSPGCSVDVSGLSPVENIQDPLLRPALNTLLGVSCHAAVCHAGGLNKIAGEEKHTLKKDALLKYNLFSVDAIVNQVLWNILVTRAVLCNANAYVSYPAVGNCFLVWHVEVGVI